MISMGDVARQAGVAKSTVSRILSGNGSFCPETCTKVFDACEKLNYKLNPNIQDLVLKGRGGATRNIAVLMVEATFANPAYSYWIDALGGVMGEAADATYLQMKMLNSSKGPAVRALRAQSDKKEYMNYMRNIIETTDNIYLKQCCITEILTKDNEICGAVDEFGIEYSVRAIVLTTGTSLEGKIWIGLKSYSAGRLGEKAAIGLSDSLHKLGLETKKLKTGTPSRVDKRTID